MTSVTQSNAGGNSSRSMGTKDGNTVVNASNVDYCVCGGFSVCIKGLRVISEVVKGDLVSVSSHMNNGS